MKTNNAKTHLSGHSNAATAKWIVILLAAFLIFFAVSPWGAYERAKYSGTETAYERFLQKHPDSGFVAAARARLANLKFEVIRANPTGRDLQQFISKWSDTPAVGEARGMLLDLARDAWRQMEDSEDPTILQRFEADFEGAPESGLARERRTDLLPRLEWKGLQSSESLANLEAFILKHDPHVVADWARGRIDALCRNPIWVATQDRLDLYQKHLHLVPESPRRAEFNKRIIDLEVAEITRGDHGDLPPASPLQITGGSTAEVKIENQTSYTLTVRYSGSNSYRFDLAPSEVRDVMLVPGPYQVAATVSSSSVIPYAGSDKLSGGSYGVKFYIETRRQ
jgi:hypothetical protein